MSLVRIPALVLTCVLLVATTAEAQSTYRVREGDTVAEIAHRLGCSQRALRHVNRLDERALISIGQRLQIPGPEDEPRRPLSKNPRIGSIDMAYWLLSNPPVGRLRRQIGSGPRMPRTLHFPSPRNVIGRGYGQGRHGTHRALDIGAHAGDRIMTVEEGIIAYAGRFRGYGNAVLVAHPGGAVTIYGHLARAVVRPGRRVRRGQVIGRAGSTGNSLGPHLHFELRVDGRPVNPSAMFDSRPVVSGPPPGLRFSPEEMAPLAPPRHGEELDEDEGTESAGVDPGVPAPAVVPTTAPAAPPTTAPASPPPSAAGGAPHAP